MEQKLTECKKKIEALRQRGKTKVPADIRQLAIELLSTHKAKELSIIIGISSKTLYRWRKESKSKSNDFYFIDIPMEQTQKELNYLSALTLELTKEIKLRIPYSAPKDTAALIGLIAKEVA